MSEDDDWWKQAERRAVADFSRARRAARLRRALRWLPHAGLTVLVVVAVVVAVQRADFSGLSWPVDTASQRQEPAGPRRLLPEELASDPWTGTPAARYASDADGIVPPAPTAVGRHSKEEVRRAYDATRRLLILSRLDTRVLEDRSIAPYLAGLASSQRARLTRTASSSMSFVSRLAPGERLLAPPRVHGTMTAKVGKSGELTVLTRYVFVYPLRPSLPVDDRADTHVIVRADVTYTFYTGDRYEPADRGVWPTLAVEYWNNISCDAAGKGLMALPKLADEARPYGPGKRPSADEPYQLDTPMPVRNDCTGKRVSPAPVES